MSLEPGRRTQRCRIVDRIGAGGMGEVWRATDDRLDREVPINVLPTTLVENEELLARFEREARTITSLNHSNLCTLYDIGHEDGIHCLVMELIDGESLGDRIRQGPLPIEKFLEIGIQVASFLEAAHERGVVHRDLKPDNAMLTKRGAHIIRGRRVHRGFCGQQVDDLRERRGDRCWCDRCYSEPQWPRR